jgi:hypothetical protein
MSAFGERTFDRENQKHKLDASPTHGINPEPKAGPRQDAEDRALSILQANKDRVLRLADCLVATGRVDADQFLRLMKDHAT